jgi:hypothetical protein
MATPAAPSGSEAPTKLWKVHAACVVVQSGFGVAYILSKVALTTGVNPVVFAVYRDVVALCTIAPVAYFLERCDKFLCYQLIAECTCGFSF